MDDLIKVASESLDNYFDALSKYGYKSYDSVYRILALLFLEDLLSNFNCMITEDDYRIISKAIDCIYRSDCTISSPYKDINNNSMIRPQ